MPHHGRGRAPRSAPPLTAIPARISPHRPHRRTASRVRANGWLAALARCCPKVGPAFQRLLRQCREMPRSGLHGHLLISVSACALAHLRYWLLALVCWCWAYSASECVVNPCHSGPPCLTALAKACPQAGPAPQGFLRRRRDMPRSGLHGHPGWRRFASAPALVLVVCWARTLSRSAS